MNVNVELLKHQITFCEDSKTTYLGLVGGYGCGKTYSFCIKGIVLASQNIGYRGALLEPTFSMVAQTLIPEMKRTLEMLDIPYIHKMSPYPMFELFFDGGSTQILLLSAENYTRLAGLNLAFFGVDEMDTIKRDLAHNVWRMLQSRMREGDVRQGFTTSTPEGFKFLYDFFIKDGKDENGRKRRDRKIIKGRTRDNPFLPKDFIKNLMATYPEALIKAYLDGEFVNLESNPVYYAFNREDNNTKRTIDDFHPDAMLHVGQDFNIGHCASIVHIVEDGKVYAVDEIIDALNTEQVIKIIQERYPKRSVIIYPDAAGNQSKTSASMSDIALLSSPSTGFKVLYNKANPRIKDRVMAMNAMFKNAKGERRYFINTKKCKRYTECLEQQVYDKSGMPDKSNNIDHPLDAGGYFIHYNYPIVQKRGSVRTY
jgi:hypothetical protein